jgi:hypothetical protein
MPRKKTIHSLQPLNNSLGLQVPGVNSIPYICGMVYAGQTNRIREIRRKEHIRQLCFGQPSKSSVAGHFMETRHCMKLNETHRLVRTEGYMDHLVKETIELQLHPNNFKGDGGFMLSRAWQPRLKKLRTAITNVIAAIFTPRPPAPMARFHPWVRPPRVYKQAKRHAESYH